MRRTTAILVAALGLAVSVATAAIWSLSRLDPNAAKPRIAALIEAQTGRALALNGPIRIGWSLRPTLSVDDARLANLPGGSRPDMARVERVEARLSLPALLHRRIEITRLTLIGPNILFEQVDGRPNWVFARQPGAAGGQAAGAGHGFGLAILNAHVQNGMVTFHFPARTSVIGLRSLDYAHAAPDRPLDLDAVLIYSDFEPFTLHATALPSGGLFDPWTTTLRAEAFDATLAARGTVSLDGAFALALSMRAPALERLNRLLPLMRLPALHGLELSTRLRNGAQRGDLPIPGQTSLRFASADLGDRLPGLSLSNVTLALPSEAGLATLSGDGRYRGQGFVARATLQVPAVPDAASRSPLTLDLSTDGASPDRLRLRGRVGLADAGFDGTLSLQARALATFRPLVAPALPALTDLSLQAAVDLPAGATRLSLRGARLHAREGDLSGDATIRLGGPLSVSGALSSSRLDLDALLPATTATTTDTALPWAALRGRTVALSWRADTLRYHGQDWPDLRVTAALDHDRLSLSLPGGTLQGQLLVDAGGQAGKAATPVSLALHGDAVPLAPLAGLAGLDGTTEGTLALSLRLAGSGDSVQALAASLDGSLALATRQASVDGRTRGSLAGPALRQLGAPPPAAGTRTAIRCLAIAGTVEHGVARLRTIALDAGPLTLSGAGTIDLGRRQVALKLHPLARLAGSKVAVPVVVSGGFAGLHATLDASGFDKIGLLVDALFGGDHPRTCASVGASAGAG